MLDNCSSKPRQRKRKLVRQPLHDIKGRIAVIDFETSDNSEMNSREQHASACSIGWQIVDVEDAVTLLPEHGSQLLRPPGNVYAGWDEHGLTPADTEHAPPFWRFWCEELFPRLRALGVTMLGAHNVPFDCAVLHACLRTPEMDERTQRGHDYGRSMRWVCSLNAARDAWADLPTYSLGPLAGELGIDIRHHDAASDARAAAEVLRVLVLTDRLHVARSRLTSRAMPATDVFAASKLLVGCESITPADVLASMVASHHVEGISVFDCGRIVDAFGSLDAVRDAGVSALRDAAGISETAAHALSTLFTPADTSDDPADARGDEMSVPCEGRPKRLRSGEWGVFIEHAAQVTAGDVVPVFVTTRAGKTWVADYQIVWAEHGEAIGAPVADNAIDASQVLATA